MPSDSIIRRALIGASALFIFSGMARGFENPEHKYLTEKALASAEATPPFAADLNKFHGLIVDWSFGIGKTTYGNPVEQRAHVQDQKLAIGAVGPVDGGGPAGKGSGIDDGFWPQASVQQWLGQ